MNRRSFLKWCGKGLAIVGASIIPTAFKEEKVNAFVVDESSKPRYKTIKEKDKTIYVLDLKEYAKRLGINPNILDWHDLHKQAHNRIATAMIEAKRTGEPQIIAKQIKRTW